MSMCRKRMVVEVFKVICSVAMLVKVTPGDDEKLSMNSEFVVSES